MKFYLFLALCSCSVFSQTTITTNYFKNPLDIPMQLSGNFGELRPNHFHAGFDIKTNQKEGLNVYAAADGYVSRIKISTVGYGKAIYITHSNGYTTVYGHLQKAVGKIQDRIIQEQYDQKEYEVEIFLKQDEIKVSQGDIIAVSGNTGGSEGPHLHFEIRENQTEKVLNPLLAGYIIKDTKKPIVSALLAYPIDENSIVNESKRPVMINLSLQPDGTYMAQKVQASGKIGFGISSYDNDDVSYNPNGTYKTTISSNGKTSFGYEFDKMVFDEARYVNIFIDYARYKTTHQRVQKLFMKNTYGLSNIKQNIENGIENVTPNFYELKKIEVSDYNNNKIIINVPVEYSSNQAKILAATKATSYLIKAKNDAVFEKNNVSVSFPANTFYDDFYLNFDVKNDVLDLGEDLVPAHTNFSITFENSLFSSEDRKKTFIATINNSKPSYNATKREGNTFTCKSKTLGVYKLIKDSINPTISINKSIENKWITNQKSISLTIFDDLSGINSFAGYINNKWVLFEYEPKLKRITHNLVDLLLNEGENILKVEATDNVGNTTTFETKFNRSQK